MSNHLLPLVHNSQDMVTQLFHKATRKYKKKIAGGSANKLHNTFVREVQFCKILYNEVIFQFTQHLHSCVQLSGMKTYFSQNVIVQ
jgi:hypothetical protein